MYICIEFNCDLETCTYIIHLLSSTDTNLSSSATPPPEYVGDDYFCDTGSAGRFLIGNFYSNDPLWDGAGCGPLNACCSFNNPPWFYNHSPPLMT